MTVQACSGCVVSHNDARLQEQLDGLASDLAGLHADLAEFLPGINHPLDLRLARLSVNAADIAAGQDPTYSPAEEGA